MDKHIHHIPHFLEAIMHTLAFLTIFKEHGHEEEKGKYLGDNFPTGVNIRGKK